MTVHQFIEKYSFDNWQSYEIENASIEYWQQLIVTYQKEKNKYNNLENLFIVLSAELREGNMGFIGVEFDAFCERQIQTIKIEKQFNPEPLKLLTNERPDIFKNDFGFTLFTVMCKRYKGNPKEQTNFSSLFYLMRDGYLSCGNSEFLKFLQDVGINITQIDTKQMTPSFKNNDRMDAFKETKEKLLKFGYSPKE
jgi:hypothetical protein